MSNERPKRAPYIVRLPVELVEKVRDELLSGPSAYGDLSDFLIVAAENLLVLERDDEVSEKPERRPSPATAPQHVGGPHDGTHTLGLASSLEALLRQPSEYTGPTLPPQPGNEPLFVLTNRFSPMLIALRVLANMTLADQAPSLDHFLPEASACARAIGLRLREQDRIQGIKGVNRRAVGWPTGEDEHKALGRYHWSFTLWSSPNGHQGPMADCGLATVRDGRAYLTPLGARAAIAPSPLLEETDGWTLGKEQQEVFRAAVRNMPGELREVVLFLHSIASTGGSQDLIDVGLRSAHPDWSPNKVTAHRAAMLGRLRELGVVEVHGWGAQAHIEALVPAQEFLSEATMAKGAAQ